MAQASDLDDKSRLVLEAIYELGGEANTSEVKQYTGIESNGVVHYRYDKLVEAGLVEKRVANRGDALDVTIASLTDEGERQVGRILEEKDSPPLTEQMAEVRQIVSDLHRQVQAMDGRLDTVEGEYEAAESWEERFGEMESKFRHIEERFRASERAVSLVHALEDAGLVERTTTDDGEPHVVLHGDLHTDEYEERLAARRSQEAGI